MDYPVVYTHQTPIDQELAAALMPFPLVYDEDFHVGGATGLSPEINLLIGIGLGIFTNALYDSFKAALIRVWTAKTKRPPKAPPILGSGPANLRLYVDFNGVERVEFRVCAATKEELDAALTVLPDLAREVRNSGNAYWGNGKWVYYDR